MKNIAEMLDRHPSTFDVDTGVLSTTIEALHDCAQACTADADADLSEQNVTEMVNCIRLCLDCVDICTATIGVTSRRADDGGVIELLLAACAATCKSCGDECERHADVYKHCRVCAQACRRCEEACRNLLELVKPEVPYPGRGRHLMGDHGGQR